MSEHQTLYRKYRPQDFTSLVGQEHIRTALTNALSSGKISHAYLFAGPRGTGKTSTARILAKALNCEQGPTAEPCNVCENCQMITKGASMDVIEIDAASNRGIDQIRELREKVGFAPVSGKYKVYIIDEVHMLTTEAFNGLLKVLEEPPAHAIFILATTEPHKIPATIHSRCQRYDFHRVTVDDITKRLEFVAQAEQITVTQEALRLIAIQADGGLRDALSLLEQSSVLDEQISAATVRGILGVVGTEGLRNLVTLIGKGDLAGALQALTELSQQGKDTKQIIVELSEYLRALLLFKTAAAYEDIYLTDTKEAFAVVAPLFTVERILACTERLHQTLEELRFAVRGKIYAELCLFDLCRIQGDTVAALAARVAQLEAQLSDKVLMPQSNVPLARVAVGTRAPSTPGNSVPEVQSVPEQVVIQEVTDNEEELATTTAAELLEGQTTAVGAQQASTVSPDIKAAPEASGYNQGSLNRLWQQVIKEIGARKKKSLVAYAEKAWPVTLDDDVLIVASDMQISWERLEKPEYRKFIEAILQDLCGHSVQLVCKEGVKPSLAQDKLPPTARKAVKFFGGTIEEE